MNITFISISFFCRCYKQPWFQHSLYSIRFAENSVVFLQTRPTAVAPPPPNENEKRRDPRHMDHRTSRDLDLSPRSTEPHTNGDDAHMANLADMRIDAEDHRNESDRPDRNDFIDRRHSREVHHSRDNRSSLGDMRDVRRPDHRHSSSHPQGQRTKSPPPVNNALSGVVLPLISEVSYIQLKIFHVLFFCLHRCYYKASFSSVLLY